MVFLLGCTESEYELIMAHGWYSAKCPCEPTHQQQQPKTFKTTSTSTEPTSSNRISACSHCDVPRRISPPGSRPPVAPRPAIITRAIAASGSPPRSLPRPGVAMPAMGTSALNSNGNPSSCEGHLVASTSIDLIDLSDVSDHYANFNPCYKSSTPPEEAPQYTLVHKNHSEGGVPSLQEYNASGRPDVLPPRSSTAPNVCGLEDLFEKELWKPRSPRASWAGPSTTQQEEEFHIYDEVYVPRTPPVEPPPRTSSLQPAKPKRTSSLRPPLQQSEQTTNNPRLQQRSASQHTVHLGAHGNGAGSQQRSPSPLTRPPEAGSPSGGANEGGSSPVTTCGGAIGGAGGVTGGALGVSSSGSSPVTDVWVPQIKHKQSASFAGLTAEEDPQAQHPRRSRLSQSCEQLPSVSQPQPQGTSTGRLNRRTKRRCPTPPRVLSPSLENFKCELIADI